VWPEGRKKLPYAAALADGERAQLAEETVVFQDLCPLARRLLIYRRSGWSVDLSQEFLMLFALSAATSVLDGLQSLASSQSSSSSSSTGQSGTAFDPLAGFDGSTAAGTATSIAGSTQISSQTLSALLDAQGQSGTTTTALLDSSQAVQNPFSQIDSSSGGGDCSSGSSGSSSNPLQALDASSTSSTTNSDGTTTTTITYADGSTVSTTSPAASTSSSNSSTGSTSAASSYNLIEQMIQQQSQALSMQIGSTLSLSV
jgi:hypothetical protein